MSNLGSFSVGTFRVETVDHRGWTPEELADRAVERIIHIGDASHPVIRDQAEVFKTHIRAVLVQYLNEAVRSDRATLAVKLTAAGHPELIKLLD